MENTAALEKLSALEQRIAQTAERFVILKEQYEALQTQKTGLEKELDDLRTVNDALSERINNLKSINEEHSDSFNKEDVRKRIDRVLEKFGELQL